VIRALVGALTLLWTLAPVGTASAGGGSPVAGKFARIGGVTKEKKSFGARVKRDDHMDVAFGEDEFSAFAVSGSYAQKGKKLRFEVDEERLLDFARSWEAAYEAELRSDDRIPDLVDCEIRKAKLKGRSKNDRVKFKATYKIRCRAEGAFGEDEARGRVRFRGKGPLAPGIRVVAIPGPGPGPFPIERPGTGGAVIEIVLAPPAEVVVGEDHSFELDPRLRLDPDVREPLEGGGAIRIRPTPGEVVLLPSEAP
jgi:hypothetical protein